MKTILVGLILLFGMTLSASAQGTDTLTMRPGQTLTAKTSKLKIKFISILEDSRCPTGVNCVWAGNAKIRVEVTSSRLGVKVIELNTAMGPQGNQFDGWAINFTGLTPHPKANKPTVKSQYRATLTLSRLTR